MAIFFNNRSTVTKQINTLNKTAQPTKQKSQGKKKSRKDSFGKNKDKAMWLALLALLGMAVGGGKGGGSSGSGGRRKARRKYSQIQGGVDPRLVFGEEPSRVEDKKEPSEVSQRVPSSETLREPDGVTMPPAHAVARHTTEAPAQVDFSPEKPRGIQRLVAWAIGPKRIGEVFKISHENMKALMANMEVLTNVKDGLESEISRLKQSGRKQSDLIAKIRVDIQDLDLLVKGSEETVISFKEMVDETISQLNDSMKRSNVDAAALFSDLERNQQELRGKLEEIRSQQEKLIEQTRSKLEEIRSKEESEFRRHAEEIGNGVEAEMRATADEYKIIIKDEGDKTVSRINGALDQALVLRQEQLQKDQEEYSAMRKELEEALIYLENTLQTGRSEFGQLSETLRTDYTDYSGKLRTDFESHQNSLDQHTQDSVGSISAAKADADESLRQRVRAVGTFLDERMKGAREAFSRFVEEKTVSAAQDLNTTFMRIQDVKGEVDGELGKWRQEIEKAGKVRSAEAGKFREMVESAKKDLELIRGEMDAGIVAIREEMRQAHQKTVQRVEDDSRASVDQIVEDGASRIAGVVNEAISIVQDRERRAEAGINRGAIEALERVSGGIRNASAEADEKVAAIKGALDLYLSRQAVIRENSRNHWEVVYQGLRQFFGNLQDAHARFERLGQLDHVISEQFNVLLALSKVMAMGSENVLQEIDKVDEAFVQALADIERSITPHVQNRSSVPISSEGSDMAVAGEIDVGRHEEVPIVVEVDVEEDRDDLPMRTTERLGDDEWDRDFYELYPSVFNDYVSIYEKIAKLIDGSIFTRAKPMSSLLGDIVNIISRGDAENFTRFINDNGGYADVERIEAILGEDIVGVRYGETPTYDDIAGISEGLKSISRIAKIGEIRSQIEAEIETSLHLIRAVEVLGTQQVKDGFNDPRDRDKYKRLIDDTVRSSGQDSVLTQLPIWNAAIDRLVNAASVELQAPPSQDSDIARGGVELPRERVIFVDFEVEPPEGEQVVSTSDDKGAQRGGHTNEISDSMIIGSDDSLDGKRGISVGMYQVYGYIDDFIKEGHVFDNQKPFSELIRELSQRISEGDIDNFTQFISEGSEVSFNANDISDIIDGNTPTVEELKIYTNALRSIAGRIKRIQDEDVKAEVAQNVEANISLVGVVQIANEKLKDKERFKNTPLSELLTWDQTKNGFVRQFEKIIQDEPLTQSNAWRLAIGNLLKAAEKKTGNSGGSTPPATPTGSATPATEGGAPSNGSIPPPVPGTSAREFSNMHIGDPMMGSFTGYRTYVGEASSTDNADITMYIHNMLPSMGDIATMGGLQVMSTAVMTGFATSAPAIM